MSGEPIEDKKPRRIQLEHGIQPGPTMEGLLIHLGEGPARPWESVGLPEYGDDATAEQFGAALMAAINDGDSPFRIDSVWMDLVFATDCRGLVPADACYFTDEPNPWIAGVLFACGLSWEDTRRAWDWYRSLPRQGEACCAAHPGEFICGAKQREAEQ